MANGAIITGTGAEWSPRCPSCGHVIGIQATVSAWLDQPAWHFWGAVGQRWRHCAGERNGYEYVHFSAEINGRLSHRLAWIRAAEDVGAEQGRLL